MIDGWFAGARSILTRACDRYAREAALLIACGTVYETFASSAVDGAEAAARALRGIGELGQIRPSATVDRYRDARNDDLRRARNALERAADLDPSTVEAVLRLGKVRLDQGDAGDAAAILERLLALRTDERTTYLVRLFLGRVRERQKRFEDASSLFREAIATVPAQSARLALANRLHAAGRNDEARALVEAATTEPDIEDPWWSYRMGRYWLIEPMLAAVRQQSRSTAGEGR
jgi:tetratricopeptide (TPR) repeat protein